MHDIVFPGLIVRMLLRFTVSGVVPCTKRHLLGVVRRVTDVRRVVTSSVTVDDHNYKYVFTSLEVETGENHRHVALKLKNSLETRPIEFNSSTAARPE